MKLEVSECKLLKGLPLTFPPLLFFPIIHGDTEIQAECPQHKAAADPLKVMQREGAHVSCRHHLDSKSIFKAKQVHTC